MAGVLALLLLLPQASLADGSDAAGPGSSVSPPIEYGECTVTCGIGIREVLLTDGCPENEKKCIVGVEACHGAIDCGWGTPIYEGLACMKISCIYMPPENRYKYVWKMLIPKKEAHILPNDSAVLKVCRDTHSGTFECETQEKGNTVASIKYTVYAETEVQEEKESKKMKTEQSNAMAEPEKSRENPTDSILVISLVTGIVLLLCVIIAMILMIRYWGAVKSSLKSKFGRDNQDKKRDNKTTPPHVE